MVIIKEFLPNPVGPDSATEYITIKNTGEEAVSLSGWKVGDLSGKTFSLSGHSLKAGAELTLFSKTTGLRLNNGGETVFLFNASGETVDTLLLMGVAQEGVPVVRYTELSGDARLASFDSLAFTGFTLEAGQYGLPSGAVRSDIFVFGMTTTLLLALVCVIALSRVSFEL